MANCDGLMEGISSEVKSLGQKDRVESSKDLDSMEVDVPSQLPESSDGNASVANPQPSNESVVVAPPPKRRGRPPGKKNKSKASILETHPPEGNQYSSTTPRETPEPEGPRLKTQVTGLSNTLEAVSKANILSTPRARKIRPLSLEPMFDPLAPRQRAARPRGRPPKASPVPAVSAIKKTSFTTWDQCQREDGIPGVYMDIPDFERGPGRPFEGRSRKRCYLVCFKSDKLKVLPWMSEPTKSKGTSFVTEMVVTSQENDVHGGTPVEPIRQPPKFPPVPQTTSTPTKAVTASHEASDELDGPPQKRQRIGEPSLELATTPTRISSLLLAAQAIGRSNVQPYQSPYAARDSTGTIPPAIIQAPSTPFANAAQTKPNVTLPRPLTEEQSLKEDRKLLNKKKEEERRARKAEKIAKEQARINAEREAKEEVERALEVDRQLAAEKQLENEKIAEAQRQLQHRIDAVNIGELSGIAFRLGVCKDDEVGILYLAPDRKSVLFSRDAMSPSLVITLSTLSEDPTVEKGAHGMMNFRINTSNASGGDLIHNFGFPATDTADTAANILRSKIVTAKLSLVLGSTSQSAPESLANEMPYKCEKCGGRWRNDNGLHYHQNIGMNPCNPNYDPDMARRKSRSEPNTSATRNMSTTPTTPESSSSRSGRVDLGLQNPNQERQLSSAPDDENRGVDDGLVAAGGTLSLEMNTEENVSPETAKVHREIIELLLDQNDGVFPGEQSMWYAFVLVLIEQSPGMPLQSYTIFSRALKSILGSLKAKKIEFWFKASNGTMLTRSVIMKPDTDIMSQAVLVLKEKIKAAGPNFYVPPHFDPSNELKERLNMLEENAKMFLGASSNSIAKHHALTVPSLENTTSGPRTRKRTRRQAFNTPAFVEIGLEDPDFRSIPPIIESTHDEDYVEEHRHKAKKPRPSRAKNPALVSSSIALPGQAPKGKIVQIEQCTWNSALTYVQSSDGAWGPLVVEALRMKQTLKLRHMPEPITYMQTFENSAWAFRPYGHGLKPTYARPSKNKYLTNEEQSEYWQKFDNSFRPVIWPMGHKSGPTLRSKPKHVKSKQIKVPKGLPVCTNCHTDKTPSWRKSPEGRTLCNACGLFLQINGFARPQQQFEATRRRNQGTQRQRQEKSADLQDIAENSGGGESNFSDDEHMLDTEFSGTPSLAGSNSFSTTFSDETDPHDASSYHPYGEPAKSPTKRRRGKARTQAKASETASGSDTMAKKPFHKLRQTTALPEDVRGIPPAIVQEIIPVEIDQNHHLSGPRQRNTTGCVAPEIKNDFMLAVIMIQTLTGGLDRVTDWVLVAKLFPNYSIRSFIISWSKICANELEKVEKLTADFQERYLEAYTSGELPPMDFDHLLSYDWKRLFNWVSTRIKIPLNTDVGALLPAKREDLENAFDFHNSAEPHWRDVMFDPLKAVHRRIDDSTSHQFTTLPLPTVPNTVTEFDILRSWVRANVMTPEPRYDANLAAAKLGSAAEDLLEEAICHLLNSRVITTKGRGRPGPGCAYAADEVFNKSLRKHLSEKHFSEACALKARLDECFKQGETSDISWASTEGEIMALTNLQARGQVKVIPKDVPMNKFGLLEGGYMTKMMDLNKLNFPLSAVPTEKYIYDCDNPVFGKLSDAKNQPPRDPRGTIPLWYGIDDQLIEPLWKKVIAAVIGIIATRPGVPIEELARIMSPSLEVWELRLLVEWFVAVGALEACIEGVDGWTVAEWWWLIAGKA